MATRTTSKPAFTLMELSVVLVLVGLIVLVLGPAVRVPRSAMRQDVCLSNLREIGAALQMYAAEDSAEQVIPIHMNMVRSCDFWLSRTANWFAWGGQAATDVFKISSDEGYFLSAGGDPPTPATVVPEYDDRRRPLFRYFGDSEEQDYGAFHCPMDVGYPAAPQIDDSPLANAGRPCWDTLGNSYRANLMMMMRGGSSGGCFSIGPFGHRLSTLPSPGQLVLAADTPFFNQLGAGEDPPAEIAYGWHGRWCEENVLYCDGSARSTSSLGRYIPQSDEPPQRPVAPVYPYAEWPEICSGWHTSLFATPEFQLDCYPAPGAVIWGDWSTYIHFHDDCWPFGGAYDELGGPRLRARRGR